MDKIGRIIFNALVSRRDIWLPCVGTFRNEYVPARDNGDGTVTPPRNRVVFIEGHDENAFPITDMITPEPDGPGPDVIYDQWLATATARGPVVIEGIGVVNNGIFTPYESLIRQLNPVTPTRSSAVRPAGKKGFTRNEKIWLALIAVFILILAGGWAWWHKYNNAPSGHNRWNAGNAAATDNMDVIPLPTGEVDPGENLFIEEEPVETLLPVNDEPEPVAPTTARTGSSDAGFYVVGNVFSVPENADKYIREMSAKYPTLDYAKHEYRGGKTLVSLFGSTDRVEANRRRRQIEEQISQYDLWLYEVK